MKGLPESKLYLTIQLSDEALYVTIDDLAFRCTFAEREWFVVPTGAIEPVSIDQFQTYPPLLERILDWADDLKNPNPVFSPEPGGEDDAPIPPEKPWRPLTP